MTHIYTLKIRKLKGGGKHRKMGLQYKDAGNDFEIIVFFEFEICISIVSRCPQRHEYK